MMEKNYQGTDQEREREQQRVRQQRDPGEVSPTTARLIGLNEGVERIIAVTVVAFLVLVAALILFGGLREIIHGLTQGGEYNLTKILSEVLLALMIAEIIGTVSSFLRQGVFDPIPFLVVGIIASVRRLLVISAESAEFFSAGVEIPIAILIELGILTVTIGVCSWSITALRGSLGLGAQGRSDRSEAKERAQTS
ncbi:MAG: phosphate-starvation-inducible PsiE family protein [Trueperaceae bacterium]|nr:phosphate-starvation-inducible PsiE family protein [Trueperaceae bacterium]